MPKTFKAPFFVVTAFLFAGTGLVVAAETPAPDAQKPADSKTVTRPAQIEPMVGPVKRAVPQIPESKAKESDKGKATDKAKAATAGKEPNKISKEPIKKAAAKSRESKPLTAKSAKRSTSGKKSKVTKKKSANKIAAKKSH